MAQPIEESLFEAIKKDDIKAFDALAEKAQCGAYRLGRFPVLSVLYLYKSRRIISKYEQAFLKITSFTPLREPVGIFEKFSQKAGKCLRLYHNEVVSPLEMLLITDRTRWLKRVYPLTKPSSAVKERLKSIYAIKYSLNVKFEGENIILDRRPLSYREKKNIATVCLCSVLVLTLAVGVPVTTVALIPKPIEGEVKKLSQIDFSAQKEYTLKNDLVIPADYGVKEVNCTIVGGGNKLILSEGATLGILNGKISDTTIQSTGGVIFSSVSQTAVIEDVTVNVNASLSVTGSSAFVALSNLGTLNGVTVNVSGRVQAVAPSDVAEATEFYFGGVVQSNDYMFDYATRREYVGTVKNCTVNYSQFEIVGEASANAAFGGVAGVNNGYLQDCTVTGKIVADTFDIAGICLSNNNGVLLNDVNQADLLQTSSDTGWNPIVCGVVLSNSNAVKDCVNTGAVSSVSTCGESEVQEGYEPTAVAVGIIYENGGTLQSCFNEGSVTCTARFRSIYAAGVCRLSGGPIRGCKNSGSVTVTVQNGYEAYAGGIAAVSYWYIYECVNEGDISVTGDKVYAGGILGLSAVVYDYSNNAYCGPVESCISSGNITAKAEGEAEGSIGGITGWINEGRYTESTGDITYFGGGVINSYFTGEIESESKQLYCGNIVGVSGENIYENNVYYSSGTEMHYFDGNRYIRNSMSAFGGKALADGGFASAKDKGATAMTKDEIVNSKEYKDILSLFED